GLTREPGARRVSVAKHKLGATEHGDWPARLLVRQCSVPHLSGAPTVDELSVTSDSAFTHGRQEVRFELDGGVAASSVGKAQGGADAARTVGQRDQRSTMKKPVGGSEEVGADLQARDNVSGTDVDVFDTKQGREGTANRLVDLRGCTPRANRHRSSPRWQSATGRCAARPLPLAGLCLPYARHLRRR